MRDEMLAFAKCMREHGIDMPDPTFDGDGRVAISAARVDGDEDASTGPAFDFESDEFQDAQKACGGKLGGRIGFSAAPARRQVKRRRVLVGVAVIAVAATVTRSRLPARREPAASDADDTDPTAARAVETEKVTRRDLVERTELDGTLGFGDAERRRLAAPGHAHRAARGGQHGRRAARRIAEVDGRPGSAVLRRPSDVAAAGDPASTDGADVRAARGEPRRARLRHRAHARPSTTRGRRRRRPR